MRKFGGLMYLLCMLILSSCSDDVCRVDGKMSDFPGETTVYLLRRTGEFTRDTLIQTVMKDGSFRVDIPRKFLVSIPTIIFRRTCHLRIVNRFTVTLHTYISLFRKKLNR